MTGRGLASSRFYLCLLHKPIIPRPIQIYYCHKGAKTLSVPSLCIPSRPRAFVLNHIVQVRSPGGLKLIVCIVNINFTDNHDQ